MADVAASVVLLLASYSFKFTGLPPYALDKSLVDSLCLTFARVIALSTQTAAGWWLGFAATTLAACKAIVYGHAAAPLCGSISGSLVDSSIAFRVAVPILGAVLLGEELKADGVSVVLLHPGFCRTEMTRKYESIWDAEGAVDVEIGAMRVLVEVGKKHESGSFVNCEDGLRIPW